MAVYKYKYVNPANPFISGLHALKKKISQIGPLRVGRDDRLREIRFLTGQTHLPEERRVKNVDRYIAKLMDEERVDNPDIEELRDIIAEVGFALEEFKASIPANQLDSLNR